MIEVFNDPVCPCCSSLQGVRAFKVNHSGAWWSNCVPCGIWFSDDVPSKVHIPGENGGKCLHVPVDNPIAVLFFQTRRALRDIASQIPENDNEAARHGPRWWTRFERLWKYREGSRYDAG